MAEKANLNSNIVGSEVTLENKVAMLFDGSDEDGRSLAVSLASHGADIAIVYREGEKQHARETKMLVEAEGRRCLIMPHQDGNIFSRDLIRQTTSTLGRLDIFIDNSSSPTEISGAVGAGGDTQKNGGLEYTGPFSNIEMMSAALDQLVHAELIDDQDVAPDSERSFERMRVAQELMNIPVISVNDGQEVGKVQGFYIDQNLTHLVAINLGSDSLFSRKESLIRWPDVVTFGQDAILVKDADCVMETGEVEDFDDYVERDEISNRPVDTPGGTKIGRIGDIILDDKAIIAGFALSQVQVSGPIAANRAINRKAVVDIGDEDGVMTADISKAEKADLQIVHEGFFAEPSVSRTQTAEASTEA